MLSIYYHIITIKEQKKNEHLIHQVLVRFYKYFLKSYKLEALSKSASLCILVNCNCRHIILHAHARGIENGYLIITLAAGLVSLLQ